MLFLCFSLQSTSTVLVLSFHLFDPVNYFSLLYNYIHVVLKLTFRYEGSIQPESLKILLEFSLARGNLKSIFKVLKLLYGK